MVGVGVSSMGSVEGETFADLVTRLRNERGLSQSELAESAGVAPRTVVAIETGETRRPHPPTVRRLAKALGLRGQAERAFLRSALADQLSGDDRAGVAAEERPEATRASAEIRTYSTPPSRVRSKRF